MVSALEIPALVYTGPDPDPVSLYTLGPSYNQKLS